MYGQIKLNKQAVIIMVRRHDIINKNKELTKRSHAQSYKFRPYTNNRPQKCTSTFSEEEDTNRSFFTIEAII